MKKKLLLPMIGLGLAYMGVAQSLSPSVISSSGAVSQGEHIQLEWTLGEPAVQSLRTSDGLITEGFHQPILNVEALEVPENPPDFAMDSVVEGELKITIAPNPVQALLSIQIESDMDQQGIIFLSDLSGKKLQQTDANLLNERLEWDFSPFPSGMYLLSFYTKKGELLKTFKVTKVK